MAPTTTLDPDPLTVDCDPEPYGCGQPAGSRCVSIATGRFKGQPKRHPCQRRIRKAGVVLTPTRPDELADDAPLRRSDTAAGQQRAQAGRIDWAGIAER
jgi:hypothetical protein